MVPSFLRSGSEWADVYYNYKTRLQTDPARRPYTEALAKEITAAGGIPAKELWRPGRYHAAAARYCAKMFLLELYKRWRPLEGLDVAPSYHEAKQGHIHRSRDAAE